jgi:hypothetical protein
MPDQNLDARVRKHIEDLVHEEHRLRGETDLSPADHHRLQAIQVELDQCWDLLRQRRAQVRPANVVERYER